MLKSLFKNIFFRIFLVIVILLTGMYQYFWISYYNIENWRVSPLYSLRLTSDNWQAFDVKMPWEKIGIGTRLLEPEVAIPYRYRLEAKEYVIDVVINPSERERFTTLELVASAVSDGKVLQMKSQWAGNCGRVDKVSEKGRWDSEAEKIHSWGFPFLTDPRATGFIWYNYSGFCKEERPQTPEYDSQFPIIVEIYDGESLIGREEIAIEIFQNGIKRSQVPF